MNINIKNKTCIAISLIALFSLFTQCDSADEFDNSSKNSVKFNLSGEILQSGQGLLVIDETNPANKYCRIDSITQYGFGVQYTIPDSLKDCNLKLVISGRMRETESITGYVAIALHGKDSIFYWGSVLSGSHVKQLNNWVSFKDSVVINKEANRPSGVELKVFPFKQIGKGYYDVDSLIVEVTRD
jgi:hypothetical protein